MRYRRFKRVGNELWFLLYHLLIFCLSLYCSNVENSMGTKTNEHCKASLFARWRQNIFGHQLCGYRLGPNWKTWAITGPIETSSIECDREQPLSRHVSHEIRYWYFKWDSFMCWANSCRGERNMCRKYIDFIFPWLYILYKSTTLLKSANFIAKLVFDL